MTSLPSRPATRDEGDRTRSRTRTWLLRSLAATLAVVAVVAASRDEPVRAGVAPETSPSTASATPPLIVFDAPQDRSLHDRLVVKFEDGTTPAAAARILAAADAELETTVTPLDLQVVEVPRDATQDAIDDIAAAAAVEYVER